MRWIPVLALLSVAGCAGQHSASGTGATSTTRTSAAPTQAAEPASPSATPTLPGEHPAGAAAPVTRPSGLVTQDLVAGDGEIAERGRTALVHYTGWLIDGTRFDSSLDRGQPLPVRLGGGQVIKGWEEGLQGMRVGGKRKLTIPPDLAYGPAGRPPVIPPSATLVFDVELVGLR